MSKSYFFQLEVIEGNDEFWEGCNSTEEVMDMVYAALSNTGFQEGLDINLKPKQPEDSFLNSLLGSDGSYFIFLDGDILFFRDYKLSPKIKIKDLETEIFVRKNPKILSVLILLQEEINRYFTAPEIHLELMELAENWHDLVAWIHTPMEPAEALDALEEFESKNDFFWMDYGFFNFNVTSTHEEG